jgi:hypothetical protein
VSWKSGTLFVVGGVFDSFDPGHLLRRPDVGPLTAIELPGPGRIASAAFTGDGFIVTMADRTQPSPLNEVVRPLRLGLTGKPIWQRVFGSPVWNTSAILAWDPHRTLVCWNHSLGDSTMNRIVCVILSSEDSRILRAPFELRTAKDAHSVHSLAIANAAVAVVGGFLVAWRPSTLLNREEPGGISLTRLDEKGNVLDTVVVGDGDARFMDLVGDGHEIVAAWDGAHAGIELAWLGADGRPLNGVPPRPVVVGAGSGNQAYWPHLAARGNLVAASWRIGRHGEASLVAAADSSGSVSPAIELGLGRFPQDTAITADDAGFTAVYGLPRNAPQIETLRCRTEAPPVAEIGAPQRIASTPPPP